MNGIRIFTRWLDQGVLAVGFIFYEKVAINEGRAIALSLTDCRRGYIQLRLEINYEGVNKFV